MDEFYYLCPEADVEIAAMQAEIDELKSIKSEMTDFLWWLVHMKNISAARSSAKILLDKYKQGKE